MTMRPSTERTQSPMLIGAALLGAGIALGAWLSGMASNPVMAAPSQDRTEGLPAITVQRDEIVLLTSNGIYFAVDSNMNVTPLRVADVELRDLPGKSMLRR